MISHPTCHAGPELKLGHQAQINGCAQGCHLRWACSGPFLDRWTLPASPAHGQGGLSS